MNASKLKGNLLEYFVNSILLNCGFKNVKADGLFIYNSRGLRLINGKGSSHDADVLMSPPIQMPFSYPYRLLFECKAYANPIGLPIVRNALGLRYDINEFEIVTLAQISERKNIRRKKLAVENRVRYLYQVGVASINGFTKPATEFSINNKIPLLSLDWILPNSITSLFDEIDDFLVSSISNDKLDAITDFLKGNYNPRGSTYLAENEILNQLYHGFTTFQSRVIIGLLETGDLIFIVTENERDIEYLTVNYEPMVARFHYSNEEKELWEFNIQRREREITFRFHLPKRIKSIWERYNYDYKAGLDMKSSLFSKLFIFVRDESMPFRIVNLDREWFERLQTE
jgi:hypothetical protein